MPSLSLLLNFYFIIVAFAASQFTQKITNPFLSYYDIQIQFILDNLIFYLVVILGITLLFIHRNSHPKNKLIKKYLLFLQRVAGVTVGASLVSFVLLLLIAVFQLNIMSLLTYISPKVLGVETNAEVIADKLKQSADSPVIIAGGKKENKLLPTTISIAQSGKDSFYGGRIIPVVPNFFVLPAKNIEAGVLMVGDTLIITEINSSDFQKVSPLVGFLMIKDYFPGRNVKSYPQVDLMDKSRYLKYREEDFAIKLDTFDEIIAKINENISSLSGDIEEKKNQIVQNQDRLEKTGSQKEKEYIKCVNTGYYQSGIFYRTNTKTYCQEQISPLEEAVSQIKKDGEELNNSLQQDQLKLVQYGDYIKFYNSQKLLTKEESSYISYEFGTFNPPDDIKIKFTSDNNSQALADYLEILIHEYLHYATFDENGKKLQSSFFEEGLTEYFARNIVRDNLGIETNLAYPVNIKIITQMSKRISERDFADIYFTNDQEGLEKLLNRVYENDFYKNNIISLETLQYLSEPNEILKSANRIMVDLGGVLLDRNDINTSFSSFR